MIKKKHLMILDLLLLVIAVTLLKFLRADYLIIAATILIIPYFILTKRKELIYYLLVSFAVSLVWQTIAMNKYGYNHEYIVLGGVSVFALLARTLSLVAVYVIYSYVETYLKKPKLWEKVIIFTAMYWPLLLGIETIAYHVLIIRNVATTLYYSGLPICDCLHVPLWMKIGYLIQGPIYFMLCLLVKLKNPHKKFIKQRRKP
jgi:hypothetical protein